MQSLQHVKYISTHYRQLQGLRLLPWFLWILAVSAVNPILGIPQGWLDYQIPMAVLGLPIALALSWAVGRYYDRQFGVVRGLPDTNPLQTVLMGIAAIGTLMVIYVLDSMWQPPVSLPMLGLAAFMLIGWWASGRIRLHLAIVAVLCTASAVLIPWLTSTYPLIGVFAQPIAMSLMLTIGAVADHLFLVRSLNPIQEDDAYDAGI